MGETFIDANRRRERVAIKASAAMTLEVKQAPRENREEITDQCVDGALQAAALGLLSVPSRKPAFEGSVIEMSKRLVSAARKAMLAELE